LDFLLVGYGDQFSDQVILSDSLSSGYGSFLSDSMNNWLDSVIVSGPASLVLSDNLNNWLDRLLIGYGNLVSDQETIADSLLAGYGNLTSDQMVILDSNSIGYGFLLSDNLSNWLDLVQTFLAGALLSLALSDNLNNWLDFLLVGYGSATSDQLVILDSASTGYRLLLSDNLNNWLDLIQKVLGELLVLTDSESGNWLDFLLAGFGSQMSGQLVLTDSSSMGYGFLLSDSLNNWLDSIRLVEGLLVLLSDNLNNWLDALGVGYGNISADAFTLLDRLAAGFGVVTSDQLVLLDSASQGYGLLLSDSWNTWLDLLVFQLLSPGAFTLTLSDNLNNWLDVLRIGYGFLTNDQLVLQEFLGAGYGSATSDQLVLVDSFSNGFGLLLGDSWPGWLDTAIFLEGDLLLITDSMTIMDQLSSGYGNITADSLLLTDQLRIGYGLVVVDNLNHWLDLIQFFTGTEARFDRWRSLLQAARAWEGAASQQRPEKEKYQATVSALPPYLHDDRAQPRAACDAGLFDGAQHGAVRRVSSTGIRQTAGIERGRRAVNLRYSLLLRESRVAGSRKYGRSPPNIYDGTGQARPVVSGIAFARCLRRSPE